MPGKCIGLEVVAVQEALADLRFQRDLIKVHHLGPRAVGALLAEIGAQFSIQTSIEQIVARYAQIDPAAAEAFGVGKFPPRPLVVIDGGKGKK